MSGTRGMGRGVLLLAAAAAVAFAGESPPAMPYDRLLRANYAALSDSHHGRLYEAAARLLEAERALPEQIDLGVSPFAVAASPAEQEVPGPVAAVSRRAVAAPAGRPWPVVLEGPVLGKEELAYAFFLAGSHEEAAALYRELHEQHADDAHSLLMLLLCERNAGHDAEVAGLLAEWRETGPEAAEWSDWLATLTKLNAEVAKENE